MVMTVMGIGGIPLAAYLSPGELVPKDHKHIQRYKGTNKEREIPAGNSISRLLAEGVLEGIK